MGNKQFFCHNPLPTKICALQNFVVTAENFTKSFQCYPFNAYTYFLLHDVK